MHKFGKVFNFAKQVAMCGRLFLQQLFRFFG